MARQPLYQVHIWALEQAGAYKQLLPKSVKVSVAPRFMKKTTTKKSLNGRRRELISWAYGKVDRATPANRAPTSRLNPAISKSAALPKPQPIANKNKNS